MYLRDFIAKYSDQSFLVPYGHHHECVLDAEGGFELPIEFEVENEMTKMPLFIVATNKTDNAIIKFEEGKLTLEIYNDKVLMEVMADKFKDYFEETYGKYLNFEFFCSSIVNKEFNEIFDDISLEINKIDGILKKSKKKDSYRNDLMILIRLFLDSEFPKVRPNFIRESYPLLRKLEKILTSVQSIKLVKIFNVYHSVTDDTYYDTGEEYKDAYKYISNTIEMTVKYLEMDGWTKYGFIITKDKEPIKQYMKRKGEIIFATNAVRI